MNAHRRKKMSKMAAEKQEVAEEIQVLPLGLKKLEESVEEKKVEIEAVEEKVEPVLVDQLSDVEKASSKKKKSFK